jgi:hypothetical protein
MSRTWFGKLGAVVALTALAAGAAAESTGGLRSEFGEVRVERLAIGKTYSLSHVAATPLVLRNTSDTALSVRIDVCIPSHHELREGALPLPDPSWLQLERRRVDLPARSSLRTDVRVTVPYDPDLAGKTFQVDFRSQVVGDPKRRQSGQRHRLVFTVAMDYRDDTEAMFSLLAPDNAGLDRTTR